MRKNLKRFTAASAVLATAVVGFTSTSANAALSAGAPATGANTLSVTSGGSSTTFAMTPPAGAACPGDSASGGYRWQTFLVDSTVDPALLTFNSNGPVAQTGKTILPMYDTNGSPVIQENTAVTTGLLTGIPNYNFGSYSLPGDIAAGKYLMGYACSLAGANTKYWSVPVTVSYPSSTFHYAYGWVPAAPALTSPLTTNDSTLDGTFSEASVTPSVTVYHVTAHPASGPDVTLDVTAPATTFHLTGLTNGTSYSVSLTAENTTGISAPSNSVSATPAPLPYSAVANLAAVPVATGVTLNWTAPTSNAHGPNGYIVNAVDTTNSANTPNGYPQTVGSGSTATYTVTGLTPGDSYTFTVTAAYTSPYSGTAATVVAVPLSNAISTGVISVARPTGALVMTQRCGVNGSLAQVSSTSTLPTLSAVSASSDQVGTAPQNGSNVSDPNYSQFPNPSTYTSGEHCGLTMGAASLLTTGDQAGSYYLATGTIAQTTVLDTRDTDAGWSLNVTMGTFTSTNSQSFGGNHMGIYPVVTSHSAPTPDGYTQTVTAGANHAPLATNGIDTSKSIASAAAGAGFGLAVIDARLALLIPVAVPSGTYTGTLTFTVV